MSVALGWSNTDGGDLVFAGAQNLLAEADPLLAEVMLSIHTDSPASPGDPVPEGVESLGYWASAFDPDAIRGSKLWILRYVRPSSRAKVLARRWTEEALSWLVDRGRAADVSVETSLVGLNRIQIDVAIALSEETRKTFRTEVLYGA